MIHGYKKRKEQDLELLRLLYSKTVGSDDSSKDILIGEIGRDLGLYDPPVDPDTLSDEEKDRLFEQGRATEEILIRLYNAGLVKLPTGQPNPCYEGWVQITQSGVNAVESELQSQLAEYKNIWLESAQKDLLIVFVEASRNLPIDQRMEFYVSKSIRDCSVIHRALPNGEVNAYDGDLQALIRQQLLVGRDQSSAGYMFDVGPLGYRYYEFLKAGSDESLGGIEFSITNHLQGFTFRKKYPEAFRLWMQAEELLWGPDVMSKLTTIGHLCREALQQFASTLVEKYQPNEVDGDIAHTKNRIRAVINSQRHQLGSSKFKMLDVLLDYWDAVNELVQRQEHGAQKEGQSLLWEDARRVVFQCSIIMFELDKTLS